MGARGDQLGWHRLQWPDKLSERAAAAAGANPTFSLDAPSRAPAVLAGLETQAHRCETTGDIETGAAFDADGLQRNRIVGAANQHIGADPDPYRNACCCASISAGQRAWWQGDGRGDDRPDDHCILHVPDINAEFRDRAGIMFRQDPSPARRCSADHATSPRHSQSRRPYRRSSPRLSGRAPVPAFRAPSRLLPGQARQCHSKSAKHCVNLLLCKNPIGSRMRGITPAGQQPGLLGSGMQPHAQSIGTPNQE